MNGTLTDIDGVRVGHVTRLREATGCTVVLVPPGTRAGVAIRGGSPGSRDLALLEPVRSVPFVDAILLTGGSAFGLSAADGVMQWLDERGIGHNTPWATVPIVPTAVIYDLGVGSSVDRPTPADGHQACEEATDEAVAMGSVGAGTGATVGKWGGLEQAMKGGVGSACVTVRNGVKIGALVVVNAIGDVIRRNTGEILAGARNADGSGFRAGGELYYQYSLPSSPSSTIQNTTLCVVATNAGYTKTELKALAGAAHNGLARALRPVNTPHDGDLVFALSCGELPGDLLADGSVAADVVQASIEASVEKAVSLKGIPGLAG